MRKRMISLLLCFTLFVSLCACGGTIADPDLNDDVPAADTGSPPDPLISDTASVSDGSLQEEDEAAIYPLVKTFTPAELPAVDGVEPYAEFWADWDNKVQADLSSAPGLAFSLSFSDKAKFSGALPAGYDPQALLEWGKYPGLNIDILQKHGFSGEGAVIAYVDQPADVHEQYDGNKIHRVNNTENRSSMHGPTVLSMLAGKDIGTAPEAEVWFYGHAAWEGDQKTHAECLYQIIEQNEKLPEDRKIRMVGFSDNIDENEANPEAIREAVKACEDAGIMVWFCGEYSDCAFVPFSDKNDPDNLAPEAWLGKNGPALVYVPAAGRTGAANEGAARYIYWGEGGLSWTMPYVLGLYGIVHQIDPTLTQNDLREMVVSTAYVNAQGMRIVNPVGFVAAALQGVGREEEAQAMLDEVKARTKYLYAVMDTSAMTEEDLSAVGSYLASITEAKVLVVDTTSIWDAQTLYTLMKQDAEKRGGTVAGVQIFGTPDMVPAFSIGYKVQMESDVDEGGNLLTDLFYGNFENDAADIGPDYNVLDHFADGRPVDLVPCWPVARLPLNKGQFSAFFEKYDSFVLDTGLQRLDIVNFSNPIFAQRDHLDDMGLFLRERIDKEFGLMDVPYRLYGNLKGSYPVTMKVLGGFEAANMTAENEGGIVELLINTHGQWNNIDNAIFEGEEEKRISLVNMENINTALSANPYYLDAWTCLNGAGMKDNLTTVALSGQCVGMFSATAIISNNGVNWRASLTDMAKSNFYYFYYHYLKALHEGCTRSDAFFTAQREYGLALIADSANGISEGGNYQFNLYNLLAYHNFGVIEPNLAALAMYKAKGMIGKSIQSDDKEQFAVSQQEIELDEGPQVSLYLSNGSPLGDEIKPQVVCERTNLTEYEATVHSVAVQPLDNGYTRFTVVCTVPREMPVTALFAPPGERGQIMQLGFTGGDLRNGTIVFDLPNNKLKAGDLTVTFSYGSTSMYIYTKVDWLD